MNTTLTTRPGNWITGTAELAEDGTARVLVEAKVYNDPSEYGLETHPTISKLWIATDAPPASRLVLVDYDRDEDRQPSRNWLKDDTFEAIADALVAHRQANLINDTTE